METTPDTIGPRMELLKLDRQAPLTAGQRAKLPAKLRNLDEAVAALRAFPLSDGGSEPATRFNPLPRNAAVSGDEPDYSAEEASCD